LFVRVIEERERDEKERLIRYRLSQTRERQRLTQGMEPNHTRTSQETEEGEEALVQQAN